MVFRRNVALRRPSRGSCCCGGRRLSKCCDGLRRTGDISLLAGGRGRSIIGGYRIWIGLAVLLIVVAAQLLGSMGAVSMIYTTPALERLLWNETNEELSVVLERQAAVPHSHESQTSSDTRGNVVMTMVIDAFDSTGRPGYIADPTAMRRKQVQQSSASNPEEHPWADVCDLPPGVGEEGPSGAQGLWKIRQGFPPNVISPPPPQQQPSNSNNNNHNNNQSSVPRILCLVYTHSGRHETALRAIVQTWGADCDGFLAISNQTDASLGAVHIWHPGPEAYNNMWQKVRHAWMYVHQHYRNDYDWFHIGGDDHYVVVPNLRRYTASLDYANSNNNNKDEPMYLGSSMTDYYKLHRFCGGGAGYTLNRPALNLLSTLLPDCFADDVNSQEDRLMGRCLLLHNRSSGVWCRNTNDEHDEQRYHALDVEFHASYHYNRKVPWWPAPLKRKHNITTTQLGLKQISTTSISFHLTATSVKSRRVGQGLRRYHALLYGKCGGDMDDQMAQVAKYNSSYLGEHVYPKFFANMKPRK